jgi:hypothetical protein
MPHHMISNVYACKPTIKVWFKSLPSEVREQDPKETNKQTNKKFGLHKMTKPYLDGQRKMDFLKADDSLWKAPHKAGKKTQRQQKERGQKWPFPHLLRLNCIACQISS